LVPAPVQLERDTARARCGIRIDLQAARDHPDGAPTVRAEGAFRHEILVVAPELVATLEDVGEEARGEGGAEVVVEEEEEEEEWEESGSHIMVPFDNTKRPWGTQMEDLTIYNVCVIP
jgi:hypothetical protein